MDGRELQEIAGRLMGFMLQDHAGKWGMDRHHWDWVPGVGVIAMGDYFEASGDAEVFGELVGWTEQNRTKAAGPKVINSMAPFAIYPLLYRHTGGEEYWEMSVRIGEWMLQEAPRTREQAFEHTVTEAARFPEQVWADTLFMAVLFLSRTAVLIGRSDFAEEAARQVLVHLQLLQDTDTRVLFHGWDCGSRSHMSAARWTRANAWVAAAVPEIADNLRSFDVFGGELQQRYAELAAGLLKFQQEDGLWSTVLDRPDFYREISGSAGIACGLMKAVRLGLLPRHPMLEEAIHTAWAAIRPYILESGEVTGVSGGTPVLESVEAYNRVKCHPTLYGQGLTLMLTAELLREAARPA